jgi:DNA ligase-1
MHLLELVETSRRVSETRSRVEKVALLAEALGRMSSAEIGVGISFLSGNLPGGRVGIGYATLRSLETSSGSAAGTAGGAGTATLTPPSGPWAPPRTGGPELELADVAHALAAISDTSGPGTAARRASVLAELFARGSVAERGFLARLLAGELRHGALEGVLSEALARTFSVTGADVRRATMLTGELAEVARALAERGAAALPSFEPTLFRPLQPMLADTAADLGSALGQLGRGGGGEAGFEYKLDGARVQVHKDGDRVEVYSRQQNPVTVAVPELVERVRRLPARQLILDGEAVGRGGDGRPVPFQLTMRRFGRRLNVEALRAELPLDVGFFDVLRLDGQTLLDHPACERWAALEDATRTDPGMRIPRLVTARVDEAEAFVARALSEGHEGAMIKSLDAGYAAGRRGQEWLKLKAARTLDLVVLAAEWGSGRRRGWLSNLHLGARDPVAGGFVMLGKTFKGMTDEILRWQTDALLARELGRDGHAVFVRPELVVEVAFNDVQQSPQYPGGVALRFARLKRYRSDKVAEDANTISEVRALLPVGMA